MDEVEVRLLREPTEENVKELIELYSELMPGIANTCAEVLHLSKQLEKQTGHFLICAMWDGHIIGTALAVCCQSLAMQGRRFMILEDVVVSEQYRGYGVGKKMMMFADSLAKKEHCWAAMLLSSSARVDAHRFYQSQGYTDHVVGFRKIYEQIL